MIDPPYQYVAAAATGTGGGRSEQRRLRFARNNDSELMPEPTPTKPYLLRAIYEWSVDNGFTPYISVVVDANTRVPMEYVRDGEIVLNIGPLATSRMRMGNDSIEFTARFSGKSRELSVPVGAVTAIYARENGHGMSFEAEPHAEPSPAPSAGDAQSAALKPAADPVSDPPSPPRPGGGKPALRRIK